MLLPAIPGPDDEKDEAYQDMDPEGLRELRLTSLFSRAMNGEFSQGPGRKYWERKKLSARHLRMIQMRASGYRNIDIANAMGMTQAAVCIILNQPEAKEMIGYLVGLATDDVIDVRTRIRAFAGEALNHIVEVTRNTRNEKLKSENSFKLLGLAGYTATEKKEVSVVAKIEGEQAASLMGAIRESMELENEDDEVESLGRFTVFASEAVEGESGALPDEQEPEAPKVEPVTDSDVRVA